MSTAPSLSQPLETTIGKYKLIASLGHGGMADVYLAIVAGPAGFNKLQVVKRLRRGLAEEPDHVTMFLDEARLAARLSHPNVVQTFEVSTEGGEYFMAMEYLEGSPFSRILNQSRKHPAPPGVLLRILTDALAGLHYAHELADYDGTPLNIVHRDASPHNIMVTFDGHTRLLDFGIAKSDVRSGATRAGTLKGKIGYMAPEQVRTQALDRRADIFVLGIILWEILAGQKMWEKKADLEILHDVAMGQIPRLSSVRSDIPSEAVRICERALARNPESRYATAAEMRGDLLAYVEHEGIRASVEEVGAYVDAQLGEKRAAIKKVIELQLNKLKASSVDFPDVGAALESSSLPVLDGGPSSATSDSNPVLSNVITARSKAPVLPAPQSQPAPESARPAVAGPQSQRVSATLLAPVAESGSGGEPGQSATQPPPAAAPRQGKSLQLAVVVGIAACAAVFVFLQMQRGNSAAPAAASDGTAAALTAPTPAAAAPPAGSGNGAAAATATASPAAKAGMVELRVRVAPATADLYLDDARLPSNPFVGSFPADGVAHRLRAEAWDHKTAAQVIVFDKDATIDLTLESKVAGGQPRAVAQAAEAASPPAAAEPATEAPPSVASNPPKGKPKRQLGDDPFTAPAATTTKSKRSLGDSTPF